MADEGGSPRRDEGPDRVARKYSLVGLDHADITVEEIPPDFVFPEPPKPAWLLEPPPTAATAVPTTTRLLLRVLPAALAGIALLTTAKWLDRRSRSRRRAFSRKVLQFSVAVRPALEEERSARAARQGRSSSNISVRSLSSCSGSLRDRVKEAERQLAVLHKLTDDGLDIARSFSWEAGRRGGEDSRSLQACAHELSRRLAKVEQAAEELRVMAEVERLLARLDPGGGGVLDGDGLSTGEDGDGAREDQSGNDAGDSDMGLSGGNGGAAQERPARLSTRAALLLSMRSSGGSDSSDTGDSSDSDSTRYVPGCVFPQELKRWCDELSAREQRAVDWLELGLERWDLELVDRALAQLRWLERPEIVKEFQKKRKDVCRKRWKLQQDLKEAIKLDGDSNTFRLREACVKAETFSATDMKEYKRAKQLLGDARAAELELEARRILHAKHILPDSEYNIHHDLGIGPTLLLGEGPVGAGLRGGGGGGGGGGGTGLFVGTAADNSPAARPAVGRRLTLLSEEENGEPCDPRDTAAGGVSGGDSMSGAHSCGSPLAQDGDAVGGCDISEQAATTASAAGVAVLGTSDLVPWGQHPGRDGARGGEMMQLPQQRMWELVEVRRQSAKDEFRRCVKERQDEHKLAYERDQKALLEKDATDSKRKEDIARLEARDERKDEWLKIEKDRRQAEKERQEKEDKDRKRQDEADRLERLWSSDRDFFSFLYAADVALTAANVARRKGFNLAPGALLNAAWGLVVAECAAGGEEGADTAAGASGAAPPFCTSSSAVDASSASVSGYDGVCGGTGGAWSDAAAGSSGEGSESTMWWALSAAMTVARAGPSWLLGQTLGLVIPDFQCEIREALSLGVWLVSLYLVMNKVGGLLGRENRVGLAAQCVILAAWVWGRFPDWVVHSWRAVVLFFVPAPALAYVYGGMLRYFERHRRPGGSWLMHGCEVRDIWFRALPTVVSGVLAWFLGAQVA